MSKYQIRQITIRDYKGIEEQTVQLGPGGIIATGRNGCGKSSLLDAIKAALGGKGADAAAIRVGASKAEILVDMGDAIVRRTIGADGAKLDIRNAEGDKKSKPAAFLGSLLGAGQLDPMAVALEPDKAKRKAAILSAIPMTITPTELREFVPDLTDDVDTSGHALDVIAGLRKRYYDQRTEANREVAKLDAEAKRAADALAAFGDAPEFDEAAEADHARATRALDALHGRAEEAERARQRTEGQRKQIAELRRQEREIRDSLPDYDLAEAAAKIDAEIRELEEQLSKLRADREKIVAAARRRDHADRLAQQADSLESALAAASVTPPSDDEIATAKDAVSKAAERVETHRKALQYAEAAKAHAAAKEALDEARAVAKSLDATVKALTHDAPAALIAKSEAIKGLGIDGDTITLDGVSLDHVNEAERLRFAVRLAKRATPHVKVLVTDGLERVDPETRDEFIREATADGWQLIGALVDRGDMKIIAIEAAEAMKEAVA